jgi:L-Ala-D/L-Glu epimerase
MRIESAELHFLEIPFRLSISHGARAGRISSDSIVLCIRSGAHAGYGEAVVREYVSGSLGRGVELETEAARITTALLGPLRHRDISWREAADHLAGLSCDSSTLPLLCAVESAVLACAVEEAGTDAYSVLGLEPVRTTVVYGGVLPLVSLEAARGFIGLCAQVRPSNLKVKVGTDAGYNEAVLALCRKILGNDFEIRVDANSSWTPAAADVQLEICERYGVRVIEQPFPVSTGADAMSRLAGKGFTIMADEGIIGSADIRSLASSGGAQVLNLRLSKNGGVSRVRALALEAEARGLSYQLGCMVGETGILSCLGRLTASLLAKPLYVEGSYDDLLLEENIVTPSFGFGPGGKAPIMRGAGMGYRVEPERLAKFSRSRLAV